MNSGARLDMFSLKKQVNLLVIGLFLVPQIKISSVEAQELSSRRSSANSLQLVAQADQLNMMYNQMNQSMGNAFQAIPLFANGLSQMENMQNEQQLYVLLQQLIPIAHNISNNFNQAYQIGQQLTASLPSGSPQAMIINQWTNLNGQGVNTFANWLNALVPMQQALQTQNSAQMETAVAQMFNAVNETVNLANGVQIVTQETNNIIASYSNSGNGNNSNANWGNSNGMSMAEYQMLSQMSASMHDTSMNILNNIGGVNCNSWNYNYSTGNDEYHGC
jgi:hypothetical protein